MKKRKRERNGTIEEEHEDEDDGAEEGKGEEEQLADITNNMKNKNRTIRRGTENTTLTR